MAKVTVRFGAVDNTAALDHGVPLFLQQLAETLRGEHITAIRESSVYVPTPAPTAIGRAAALHGTELLRLGYSLDQVVHDYGDVCQAVTELAGEQHISISTDEFRTLNRCLDNAIADAVASFESARQISSDAQAAATLQQRLQSFSDDHQRLVDIAVRAFAAIKTGEVGLTGATGALLALALEELRSFAERPSPDMRHASAAEGAKDLASSP